MPVGAVPESLSPCSPTLSPAVGDVTVTALAAADVGDTIPAATQTAAAAMIVLTRRTPTSEHPPAVHAGTRRRVPDLVGRGGPDIGAPSEGHPFGAERTCSGGKSPADAAWP